MHGILSHWDGSIAVGKKKKDMSWQKKKKVKRRPVGDTCHIESVLGYTSYSETENLTL